MKKSCIFVTAFFAALLFVLPLSSCVSKPIPIPGERKISISNIYVEYLNIAEIYYSLEKYDKALEYYKLAMQNSDLYWGCYYKIARVYAIQSNWDSALPMYRRLLRRDKNNDSIKASIAYILAIKGEFKKAKKAYKELLFLQPDNQQYLENMIGLLFAMEEYAEGKSYLKILKEKFPDSENIQKFDELIKKIDDENAEEIDVYDDEDDKNFFEKDLEENPDVEENLDLPLPPPATGSAGL